MFANRKGGLYTTPKLRKTVTPSLKQRATKVVDSFGMSKDKSRRQNLFAALKRKLKNISRSIGTPINAAVLTAVSLTVIVLLLCLILVTNISLAKWADSRSSSTSEPKSKVAQMHEQVHNGYEIEPIKDLEEGFDQALRSLRKLDYRTHDTTVIKLSSEFCLKELPFQLDDQSEFDFMTNFAHLVEHVASKKEAIAMHAESTVVSEDGTIWSKRDPKSLAKHQHSQSAGCTAITEFVKYSQQLYPMSEETIRKREQSSDSEHYDQTYQEWKKIHESEWVTGDLKTDAAHFMKAMSWTNWNVRSEDGSMDDKEWEVQYRLQSTLDKYCPQMEKQMSSHGHMTAIHQTHRYLRTSEDGPRPSATDKVAFDAQSGDVMFVDASYGHSRAGFVTCDFIDELFLYGQGTVQDRIKATVDELKNGQRVSFEIHLEHLLRDECPSVITNLNDGFQSFGNLVSHTAEMIQYMTSQSGGIGKDSFVATADGALLHRSMARQLGYKHGQIYECPLLGDLVAIYGDTSSNMADEQRFAHNQDSDTKLQQEIDELFEHRFTMHPNHDLDRLLDHYSFAEQYQFDSMCRQVIQAYETRLVDQWTKESNYDALNNLVHSLKNAIQTVADPLSKQNQNKVSKDQEFLVIDGKDGWVYIEKVDSRTYNKQIHHRSLIFDEIDRRLRKAHAEAAGSNNNKPVSKKTGIDNLWESMTERDLISARHDFDQMMVAECSHQTSKLETTLSDGFQLLSEVVSYDQTLTRRPRAFINYNTGKVTVGFSEESKSKMAADSTMRTCSVFDKIIDHLHLKQSAKQDEIDAAHTLEDKMVDSFTEEHIQSGLADMKAHIQQVVYLAQQFRQLASELDLLQFDADLQTFLSDQCPTAIADLSVKNLRRLRLQIFDSFDRMVQPSKDGQKTPVGITQPVFDISKGNLLDESESTLYSSHTLTRCPAFTALFTQATTL